MTHNFKEVPNHPRRKPGFMVWRCENCDSEALFKKYYDKDAVNKIISSKLQCLPPIGTDTKLIKE